MRSKIISAEFAASQIADGATVGVQGCATILVPEAALASIERRYLDEGHPKDITAFLPVTASLGPGTGLDRLAHEGLMGKIIAPSYPIYKGSPVVDLVVN